MEKIVYKRIILHFHILYILSKIPPACNASLTFSCNFDMVEL